jgi:phospho-N-acetylmuramoyl-pentapeptide-transferase
MKTLFRENFLAFRLLGGLCTAFGLSLWLGPYCIRNLSRWQPKQPVREYVPDRHLLKSGTPTLGGILILTTYTASALLWISWNNPLVWIIFLTLVGFGCIGLVDDLCKIKQFNHRGLSARTKYGLQSILGLVIAIILYKLYPDLAQHKIGSISFNLGWFFIPWAYWVIVGSSNAFNLTDGLDGLAASQAIIVAIGLLILALSGGVTMGSETEEVIVLCSILIGSSFGFLWHNLYPAKIFMGDIGALALGACLGTFAMILHQEVTFAMMALVPLLETLSVILQVLVFKSTKKRLFRMAPFHHHLELLGKSEPAIVAQFSIATVIMVCITLLWRLI